MELLLRKSCSPLLSFVFVNKDILETPHNVMRVFTYEIKYYSLSFYFKLSSGLIFRYSMRTAAFVRLKNSKCKLVKSCFKCSYCPFPMDHVTDGARWMRFLPVTRARHHGRQERRHGWMLREAPRGSDELC